MSVRLMVILHKQAAVFLMAMLTLLCLECSVEAGIGSAQKQALASNSILHADGSIERFDEDNGSDGDGDNNDDGSGGNDGDDDDHGSGGNDGDDDDHGSGGNDGDDDDHGSGGNDGDDDD